MFDIRLIRNHPEIFDNGLQRRGLEPCSEKILALDESHRHHTTEMQSRQAALNAISKEFGQKKAKGEDTSHLQAEVERLKHEMKEHKEKGEDVDAKLREILISTPNLPAEDCPDGKDESDNVEQKKWGTPKEFSFEPKPHYELGENLKMMDFEVAAKLSGSRFVVMYNDLVRLERALSQMMLDTHTQQFGYTEVYVPLMVNDNVMFGTGQLPKFRDDQFQTNTGHWLIPTAEVALTNLVAETIISEDDLPMRLTAYTPCFRAEAGAAGRDTRGIIRQHQFSKVELVSIVTPEQAVAEHERMTTAAETILQKLDLPYRLISLCAGDMGFSAEKTFDIEVWLPSQNTYREISSCSRCNTFQARRMNARYRPQSASGGTDGKPQFVHTLNGSGVAVGRALVAVMENYQQEDGSIIIPQALRPYMGGQEVIVTR